MLKEFFGFYFKVENLRDDIDSLVTAVATTSILAIGSAYSFFEGLNVVGLACGVPAIAFLAISLGVYKNYWNNLAKLQAEKTTNLKTLTKDQLLKLLEPFDDNTRIAISITHADIEQRNQVQGNVRAYGLSGDFEFRKQSIELAVSSEREQLDDVIAN